MSPADTTLVEKKLQQIADRITHLERYHREGWDKYKDDFERKKTAEKLLQEMIEAAIDVNTHVLVETSGAVPDDYYSSFLRLAEIGWITADLATELAPSAGLRNRLVHQYAAIDDQKIFRSLGSATARFRTYITQVRGKLGSS